MKPSKKLKFPSWAQEKATELKHLEIHLGHLPKEQQWDQENLAKLQNKISSWQEADLSEEKTELLFTQLVKGLTKEGFDTEEICQFINKQLKTSTSTPKYCDLKEVGEALES